MKVGDKWLTLDGRAKMAALLHESHHIKAWHKWRRIGLLIATPFLFVVKGKRIAEFLQGIAHEHEYAADGFAKSKGYGADFARALLRYPEGRRHDDRWFHPPLTERLRRLDGAYATATEL